MVPPAVGTFHVGRSCHLTCTPNGGNSTSAVARKVGLFRRSQETSMEPENGDLWSSIAILCDFNQKNDDKSIYNINQYISIYIYIINHGARGALFSELCGGNMFRLCSIQCVPFASSLLQLASLASGACDLQCFGQNATAMLMMASSDGNYPLVN